MEFAADKRVQLSYPALPAGILAERALLFQLVHQAGIHGNIASRRNIGNRAARQPNEPAGFPEEVAPTRPC